MGSEYFDCRGFDFVEGKQERDQPGELFKPHQSVPDLATWIPATRFLGRRGHIGLEFQMWQHPN